MLTNLARLQCCSPPNAFLRQVFRSVCLASAGAFNTLLVPGRCGLSFEIISSLLSLKIFVC